MRLFVHRYLLQRKKSLQTQKGALLKIESEGFLGVADICPWPHLGDASLEIELENRGPLFQRALQLAQKDWQARKDKIHLNSGAAVKNHTLMTELQENNIKDVIKIKGDADFKKLAHFINTHDAQFRLDFNSALTADQYSQFLDLLTEKSFEKIECVEDPFAYDPHAWKKSPLKIAADFIQAEGWPYRVIKPSRHEVSGHFLYLTSAMDHPIGVAHGLVEAQKYPDKVHGFLTLDLYEETPFHQYFHQHQNELSYKNDGYGLGFETELKEFLWEPLIDYHADSPNEIFSTELGDLKSEFDKNISDKGYFLIPSSGSSHQVNQSLKLYAISKAHFLNSAERVNMEFNLTRDMNWGCVLPTHHVGGLSILARAHLAHAAVFFQSWKNFSVGWLIKHQIQLLSLVPTQLFDLVREKVQCPAVLKYVFIGGASLSPEIEQQARDLGWPLVVTFGMTETSSMIASRLPQNNNYQPFQGVEISVSEDQCLKIKCDSLAEYCLQKTEGQVQLKKLIQNGFYTSEDKVEIHQNTFHFLSRGSDQIKINGEGVSLAQLREKLEQVLMQVGLNPLAATLISVPDTRKGQGLVMVFAHDAPEQEQIVKKFNQQVRPFEKVLTTHTLQTTLPVTELNKIKYQTLKELVQNEKI